MSSSMESRRRNPRGAGGQLRSDIVRAAGELLAEADAESTVTLRAVARRVGIAAPSIYAHFDTPEQIVDAVVVEAFATLQARVQAARQAESEPPQRLLAGCRAYVAFGAEHPGLYVVLFGRRPAAQRAGTSGSGPVRAPDRSEPAELGEFLGFETFDVLVRGVQECIEDGSSQAESAFETAVGVWIALHGLVELRADTPAFPWPDPTRTETDLVTRIAQLTV